MNDLIYCETGYAQEFQEIISRHFAKKIGEISWNKYEISTIKTLILVQIVVYL